MSETLADFMAFTGVMAVAIAAAAGVGRLLELFLRWCFWIED
jgi:hypothetical protein